MEAGAESHGSSLLPRAAAAAHAEVTQCPSCDIGRVFGLQPSRLPFFIRGSTAVLRLAFLYPRQHCSSGQLYGGSGRKEW